MQIQREQLVQLTIRGRRMFSRLMRVAFDWSRAMSQFTHLGGGFEWWEPNSEIAESPKERGTSDVSSRGYARKGSVCFWNLTTKRALCKPSFTPAICTLYDFARRSFSNPKRKQEYWGNEHFRRQRRRNLAAGSFRHEPIFQTAPVGSHE